MKVHYNVTGEKRKAMVKIIEGVTGQKLTYLGMPSQAYEIGDFMVDRNGTLEFPGSTDGDDVMDALKNAGFRESIGFTVELPRERMNLDNLDRILEAKGSLIKKSLGLDDLPVLIGEDKVAFQWFNALPDPDVASAAAKLIAGICQMSLGKVRMTPREEEPENEKYAFRCFLLRLGFIGEEFRETRQVLLRNLYGKAAFKGVTGK